MRAVKDQFDPGTGWRPAGSLEGSDDEQLHGTGRAAPPRTAHRRRDLDPASCARLAADCVHCGFCLPACPTYQLWGEEMDSPRGRIHLITQILDGAQVSEAAAEHLDRCLGCMACVTACPSGVRYDQLIEAARGWAEDAAGAAGPGEPAPGRRAAGRCASGRSGRRSSPRSPTRGGCGC